MELFLEGSKKLGIHFIVVKKVERDLKKLDVRIKLSSNLSKFLLVKSLSFAQLARAT